MFIFSLNMSDCCSGFGNVVGFHVMRLFWRLRRRVLRTMNMANAQTARMTTMTIPAMAPPERPLWCCAAAPVASKAEVLGRAEDETDEAWVATLA